MKRKPFLIFLIVIIYIFILTIPAFAADYYKSGPVYVHTSDPNTTIYQSEMMWADETNHSAATLTSVNIRTLLQAGDQVTVEWYDINSTSIGSSSVNGSSVTITPPSGAYGAKLVLVSSSESGDRWAWWHAAANTWGNTTYFPDPDTGGTPPSGGTVDLTPVVSALEIIQGQLTAIQGQLNNLSSTSSSSSGQLGDILTAIQNQTGVISSKFDEVTGQLSSIGGQLDTLDSHVVDIYDYLSTPRTAQPFQVNMPVINIDPTPQPITEPPQQPYTYERNVPQMPPFEDSPGPLPIAPEPIVMEHDPPRETNPPVTVQQPRDPDPVIMDTPIPRDPVQVQTPRAQDPVLRQEPRSITPVAREIPRQVEQPVTRDNPIQPEQPFGRDTPLQPDPPLVPNPPM